MKKTITVNLSGMVFTLDDDAYEALQGYLDAIKDYFQKKGDEEVIKDIETSIAEKFSAKITKSKEVISKKDVDELIKVLGTVDDIIEEDTQGRDGREEQDGAGEGEKKYHTGKRLYRNTDDAVIAGVASGLAAFFGIDPILVRLIFALTVFFGGTGILLYLILWLVMPPAKSSVEKLEMRGEPVTLEAIEEVAKRKSKRLREMDTSGVRRLLVLPFHFLNELIRIFGRVIRKFSRVILVIIGLALVISMILAMTGVGLAGAALVFNYDSPLVHSDIPLNEIIGLPFIYVGVAAILLVILVPLFFILLLGTTMIGGKSSFRAATSSVLIGIWMVAVITTGVVALDSAPRIKAQIDSYRQGETVSRDYTYDNFDSLRTALDGDVTVRKGDAYAVVVTADEDALSRLNFDLKDGELKIVESNESDGICLVCLNHHIAVDITMPELKSFIAFQSVIASVEGFEESDMTINAGESARVNAIVNGGEITSYVAGTGGRVELAGSPESLDVTLEGLGRYVALELDTEIVKLSGNTLSGATLAGRTDNLDAELGGSAVLYASDLAAGQVTVKTDSNSRAEVFPVDSLKAVAEESSNIFYRGNPPVLNKTATENARIENLKDSMPESVISTTTEEEVIPEVESY